MENETKKPIYVRGENVTLLKRDRNNNTGGVVMELNSRNAQAIDRIRFYTDLGKITWKPKKTKLETVDIGGIPTERKVPTVYTLTDLQTEMPHILEIAKLSLTKDVELSMCYVEKEFYNEKEKETETYFFMMNSQAWLMYCSEVEETDEKLQMQLKPKEKDELVLGE